MGLILISELALELVIPAVIDVQIHKINLTAVFRFQPVHDGRQSLAARSPESEEFNQGWAATSQRYRRRIGGSQFIAHLNSRLLILALLLIHCGRLGLGLLS